MPMETGEKGSDVSKGCDLLQKRKSKTAFSVCIDVQLNLFLQIGEIL